MLLHPNNGVVIIEIKDWANQILYRHDQKNLRLYVKNPDGKTCLAPSQPLHKINLYKDEIKSLYALFMHAAKHFSVIIGMLVFTNWTVNKIAEVFSDTVREQKYFPKTCQKNLICCGAELESLSIDEFLPSANLSHQ